MELELILTYEDKPQDFLNLFCDDSTLKDEQTFFDFATNELSEEKKENLCKISTWAITDKEPPKWFIECNGKLWIENGKLI